MITDDIVAFIRNEGKVLFDEIANSNANYDAEFDEEKYYKFIKKSNISAEYSPKIVLENLGLIKKFGESDVLNNAGILFFGKHPAFYFPHSIITCVLYKGTEKLYILDRKDFDSDLISNIEDTIIFLQKHLNISYQITSLQRKNILEIPEEALREAVVNSVVHRDYFEKGANILIEIFDNRVEISNPGGLVKGLTLYDLGTKSITRNPLISLIMLRAKYIEKLGTGIHRIQTELENAGLSRATFDIDYFFTVTMYRDKQTYKPLRVSENTVQYRHILHESSLESSPTSSPTGIHKYTTKDNIYNIFEMIKANPNITNKEIAIKLGISDRSVKKHISKLKENNRIRRVGSNYKGYWQVIDYKDN